MPTAEPKQQPAARRLTRHETHDLGMIIKDRTKVLEAHVDFYSEKRPDGSLTLVAKPKTPQGHDLIARMKALDPTTH